MNWLKKISQISEDIKQNVESHGFQVIECKKVNKYNVCLAFMPGPNIYQIGISAENLDFTNLNHQSEKHKYTGDFNISTIYELSSLVKTWMNKYQPIYIGSMISEKNKKWMNVFSYLGFKIKIENMHGLELIRLN